MLNATSGASYLPRDLIQWLVSLDLSYAVTNPKMDLSNGFIIAQILTRVYMNQISIYTFYNNLAKDKKINNWQQIQKCKLINSLSALQIFFNLILGKKGFKVSDEEYESIINMGPETAASFLFRLYEFVTENKLNLDRRLATTIQAPSEPLYKKPTASSIAKDRQLHRVVDLKQKQMRTKTLIQRHTNEIHNQKYNTGLIEWLIQKRKQQIQNEVQRQREEIEKKTKSVVNAQSKVQVKQIQLKCFNSSTSKKKQGQYGDFTQNKGVLEFLKQSCALILKKEHIANDLKKLGIQIKQKQGSQPNILEEIFSRCEQLDPKGNRKFSAESMKRILEQFRKSTEMNMIIASTNDNFLDFQKFFKLFIKPMKFYDKDSEVYKIITDLILQVAKGLLKVNPQNAEMMFQQVFLKQLLQVGQNQYKRSSISQICLSFSRNDSNSYFSIIQRVKQNYKNNIKVYVSYLAHFLDFICKECENVEQNLWSQFFFYGFLSLTNMAPSIRVNGAKIIAKLFTDLVVASDQIINEKIGALKNLVADSWWQVRAQAIIIFKAILLSKHKGNQNSDSASINDDLNMKTILHYILDIFTVNTSHNILRVGLIQLAELLNYEQSLCERYLEILLNVGNQIRADVLTTSVIKYGPVVYGSNTFVYKLTGAPLEWNSIGITRVLNQNIRSNQINQLNKAHLQILNSALIKSDKSLSVEWLKIYQSFKQKIFKALLDQELCENAALIIRQFLQIQQIHSQVVKTSRTEVSRVLSQINIDVGDSHAKSNLLSFFQYLRGVEPEYIYQILKDFAQRQKTKYLASNFVEFMNSLSRDRRKIMFQE